MSSGSEQAPSRFDDRPVHELFEKQAAHTPDRIAVVCDGLELSYRAVSERANQLAHRLHALGVGPEMLVAVCLERSLELVVTILGILKAGAAYVPLDPESPPERLASLLQDASVAAVVAHAHLLDRLPPAPPGLIVVDGERPWFDREPVTSPITNARSSSLAYVIYTSGSTGTPKGVLVEHRSVVSLFRATERLFRFEADDVWTLFHSAAFDFSVWEIWGALLHGARLVVVPRQVARSPEDFHDLCVREQVTVLNQTPSAFLPFIHADAGRRAECGPLALRYVILGGEALEIRNLRPWLDVHGDERPQLINMYGITETTVHVTFRRLTVRDAESGSESRSLIGRPIPGYLIHLLEPLSAPAMADGGDHAPVDTASNAGLEPVAAGEVGEISVGGFGVARGYLNRPELTAQRFVRNTLDADPAARLYRSGDLGRLLPNGDLEYLGRLDHQVKIRGFRIELGEIEAVLSRHDAVAQSAVVAREDTPHDKRLVAYWVRGPGHGATAGALRSHIAATLPVDMIPSVFVELPQMPLTVNGKLNRRALPVPAPVRAELVSESEYEAPRETTEAQLSAIWSEVLGLDPVGVHDNFFELGGHSLSATQVAVRIRARLGVRVALSQIFEQPTIALLAPLVRALGGRGVALAASDGAAIEHGDRSRFPMSFPQRGLWFVHQLSGDRTAYLLPDAWRLRGRLDVEALGRALETIVSRHAPLRTRFDMEGGEPIQIIDEPRPVELAHHDLRRLTGAALEAEVERLAAEEADRPFDLAKDLLIRAGLLTLGHEHYVLLLTVHHIASDGCSQQILRRELEELYRSHRTGVPPSLDALPIQYAEFAARQRKMMTAGREAELRRYWRRQLAGLTRLELPGDRRRPLVSTDRGAELTFEVPESLLNHLERLASENHVTLQMLLIATYHILLARYSGQLDVAVATFTAGRDDADVEGLVGVFVNQIILRADLSGGPTFREFLGRVRTASLSAYDHQDLPFERLVADVRADRRPDQNPFASVAFQFLPAGDSAPVLDGLETTHLLGPTGVHASIWR